MRKFNWDKYFEDLEEGDPRTFPYIQFIIHETINGLHQVFGAIFFTLFLIVVFFMTLGILQHDHPKWLVDEANISFCRGLLSDQLK